ncbi:sirohydrochlorin chelatase [Neobacillus sp. FSL H8-0543]|uniref:sirohydrochlorin chelatase n=1 Tax=Neobacillus sp. FSL H8-0543 TaxID=2954672 RepID=UPI0031590F70
MEAIIYIAHGSRRQEANEKFIAFIGEVMKRSGAAVQAFGFIEHAEPTIRQAIEECTEQGVQEITVVPVLLLPGIHSNEDIPAECKGYPNAVFYYGKPIGVDEIMVNLLYDRLSSAGFGKHANDTVLLVGHGSREPAAAIEFERLANGLSVKIAGEVYTGYLTTSVSYQDKIKQLSEKNIYILPYLLFSGGYTAKMEKEISGLGARVTLCDPIGFDEKLYPLIQKRANEVWV